MKLSKCFTEDTVKKEKVEQCKMALQQAYEDLSKDKLKLGPLAALENKVDKLSKRSGFFTSETEDSPKSSPVVNTKNKLDL